MDKNDFEFIANATNEAVAVSEAMIFELSDHQLAFVGGGIGDTIL